MSTIRVELVQEDAVYPERQTRGSAGYDMAVSREVYLAPGQIAVVDTGVRLWIPAGEHVELRSRSSMFLQGLIIHPGLIDSDFHETVKVLIWNANAEFVVLSPGTRVCQFVLDKDQELEPMEHHEDGYVAEDLPERTGGLGSTGTGAEIERTEDELHV